MSGGLAMPIRDGAPPLGLRISNIVMSVPHSGTRSLVETGINGQDCGLQKWWHFYIHEDRIEKHLGQGHNLHLHIPVRDPLDVATGWAVRQKKLDGLLKAFESMFRVLERTDVTTTLHKTTALPHHIGIDDKDKFKASRIAPIPAQIRRWHDAIREAVLEPHLAFYEEHLA